MGKYAQLGASIKTIELAIEDIRLALGDIKESLVGGENDAPAESQAPAVTLEQVRAVLAEKARAGHTDRVRELLGRYGADRLSAVQADRYADLLRDAEGIA